MGTKTWRYDDERRKDSPPQLVLEAPDASSGAVVVATAAVPSPGARCCPTHLSGCDEVQTVLLPPRMCQTHLLCHSPIPLYPLVLALQSASLPGKERPQSPPPPTHYTSFPSTHQPNHSCLAASSFSSSSSSFPT